jgi:hypothetical protein
MSKLISRSLAFLFTLTLAGAASARRPPSLAEVQEHADGVYATCAESRAQPTAGYRDMLARVATAKPTASEISVASLPSRKMGDHLVLVCAGGEVHQGSGYRDFPARLQGEPTGPQIASGAHHLVGMR